MALSSAPSNPEIVSPADPRKPCHQCRRMKTADQIAVCSRCSLGFCCKCLLNRYAENVQGAVKHEHWQCPRCRGICNCSVCMKKKGQLPTGVLGPVARTARCGTVLEWLQKKMPAPAENQPVPTKSAKRKKTEGASVSKSDQGEGGEQEKKWKVWSYEKSMWLDRESIADCMVTGSLEIKSARSCTEIIEVLDLEKIEENKEELDPTRVEFEGGEKGSTEEVCGITQRDVGAGVDPSPKLQVIKPTKRVIGNKSVVGDKVLLPQGTELTMVAGLELLAEDVGPALQFLEFCSAFGNVLSLTKGQPELILRELLRGRSARWAAQNSLVAQFHIRLLSLLHEDAGERPRNTNGKSWLHDLKRFIGNSQISQSLLDENASDYDNLDPPRKLRVLNFLCDDVLGTERVRGLIDEENAKFFERKKEERQKHLSEKENWSPNQPSEEHAPNNGLLDPLPKIKKKQRSDALRTEPLSVDQSGHAFWRLRSYCDGSRTILQDIKNLNMVSSEDKWFVYSEEHEKSINEHVSSIKNWRWRNHRESVRQALMVE